MRVGLGVGRRRGPGEGVAQQKPCQLGAGRWGNVYRSLWLGAQLHVWFRSDRKRGSCMRTARPPPLCSHLSMKPKSMCMRCPSSSSRMLPLCLQGKR